MKIQNWFFFIIFKQVYGYNNRKYFVIIYKYKLPISNIRYIMYLKDNFILVYLFNFIILI